MIVKRLAAALAVVLVGLAGVVVAQSNDPAPVSDLSYVRAESGDSYWSIVARYGLSCSHTALWQANGRAPLDPGTIVFVPLDCLTATPTSTAPTTTNPPTTTQASTTTEAPTTTQAPTTTSTSTTVAPSTTTEPPATSTTVAPSTGFVETFDTAASLDRLVFAIADGRGWPGGARSFTGDHSPPDASGVCGSPATSRTLTSGDEGSYRIPFRQDDDRVRGLGLAYWCANGAGHFMTALDTSGYAHFDFRPDQTLTDVSRVCWDQNITDMGTGQWTEMAVVPLDTFTANGGRMDYTHPDRNGPGQPGSWGLQITDGVFKAAAINGQLSTAVDQSVDRSTVIAGSTNDKASRLPHCVEDNGDGTVTFTRGWIDGATQTAVLDGSFSGGEVVVIFSDVNYNPTKRVGWDAGEFTWHWDNIVIG